MSRPLPPHFRAIARLNRARVQYLLFGLTAINHYASDPSQVFFTADCDILLRPSAANLKRALAAVVGAGYELFSGGEPLPRPDALVARRLVEHRALVTARKVESLPLDLMLDSPGVSFADLWRRRRAFTVHGTRVTVASLEDLLAAKARAGRPKDKSFLAHYHASLGTQFSPKRRGRSSGKKR